jgi:DNA-binding transcriptional LysR family regulator
MRINHRQIEAFRAVFQTASMTAAGALMGITQPAVSRLIRDLEAEIALKLFDRFAGKLTPTPDAVALFREVERSYQGLDRVAHAAAQLGRRREGELRIAASVAPSFHGLPPVLTRFRATWPGVLLSVHTGSSPEVLDLVAMRHCDLGVAVLPAEGPGVTIEALPAQNAVCVLPTPSFSVPRGGAGERSRRCADADDLGVQPPAAAHYAEFLDDGRSGWKCPPASA